MRDKLAPALVFAATATLFSPVVGFPFLNWDDVDVFVRNDALRAPGLLSWAFTTRYMEHYQPLAWLTWGALERTAGLTSTAAHALNVALHALCAAGVYSLSRRVAGVWPAAIGALVWSVHPLRVEVVAWASAMPYSLALLLALVSMRAWLAGRHWAAVAWLTLSLLARPIALALPVVWWVIGRGKVARHSSERMWRPALAGLAIAVAAALAESTARLTATLAEFGIGARLTLTAAAPWQYLWRTVIPVGLTPLDPLALTPRTDIVTIVAGLAGIGIVSAAAWRWRAEQRVLAASWMAYLALLVPAMGLVPSGLQATADRYTYVPAVCLSIALAHIVAMTEVGALRTTMERMHLQMTGGRLRSATTLVVAACALLVSALGAAAWQQAGHWRDSVALWTRAVELDASNDVALYNLGAALDEAGRGDEALARYEQVLTLVPGHGAAAHNRDLLRARQLEAEGNRLAAAGRLGDAVALYREAVRLDGRRTHSHAALGMALTQLGRVIDARPHLQAALDQGASDPAVPNALAFGLAQGGDRERALDILRAARARFPDDPNIARNLAILSER